MTVERAIELQEQSWSLEAEGKLDEAFSACREALRLIEVAEGAGSPDVANLLNDLAEIEQERQNFMEVLALTERARSVEGSLGERFSGEDAARIRARTLAIAGAVYRAMGDYAHAESDLKEALAVSVAAFGEASEEAAEARNNLGMLYKYCGRFDDGLKLYGEALGPITAVHGGTSLAAAILYHNIGGILHAQDDFAAAETPARWAWHISRKLRGEDDPQTMADAVAYAAVLDGLGLYDQSEPIYRRALTVFERAYGPEHYEVAATLHNLAAVLNARGQAEEAEKHYRRALAIKEKLLSLENPDVALTRNNLGKLLSEMGRTAEAVPLLEAAVAVLELRLPSGHPQLAAARENLRNSSQS